MSSPISNTFGKDALRVALNINRREVIRGQVVTLESMWTLFRDQGLDPQHISVAFLRMKKLETKLGVEVVLPSDLTEVPNELTISSALAKEIDEILGGVERTNPQLSVSQLQQQQKQQAVDGEQDGVQWKKKKKSYNQKQRIIVSGSVLGVLTAMSLAMHLLSGPSSVDPKSFAGSIPISDAWKEGAQVEAKLSNMAWLSQPEAPRKEAMRRALKALAADGVESLILIDGAKKIRGVISRAPSGLEELYFK